VNSDLEQTCLNMIESYSLAEVLVTLVWAHDVHANRSRSEPKFAHDTIPAPAQCEPPQAPPVNTPEYDDRCYGYDGCTCQTCTEMTDIIESS
jgi:hypothetical protein